MFKSKYSYGNNPFNNTECSKLVAVFDFTDETAPQDREAVGMRLNLGPRSNNLADYLKRHEGIQENRDAGGYFRIGSLFCRVKIRRHCRGLGVTIKMDVAAKLEAKEMLDLDRLDQFINTGLALKKDSTTCGPAP